MGNTKSAGTFFPDESQYTYQASGPDDSGVGNLEIAISRDGKNIPPDVLQRALQVCLRT